MISVNSFKDDLNCSICLDIYDDPRTLSCQHSFCTKCLEPLARSSFFKCPQCRAFVHHEGLECIPRNNLIVMLIESLKTNKHACPECKEIKELTPCNHCSHLFCSDCNQVHCQQLLDTFNEKKNVILRSNDKIEKMRNDLDKAERLTLTHAMSRMKEVKADIKSLFQKKQYDLIAQINDFYMARKRELPLKTYMQEYIREIDMPNLNNHKEASSFLKNIDQATRNIDNIDIIENHLTSSLESCKQNKCEIQYNPFNQLSFFNELSKSVSLSEFLPVTSSNELSFDSTSTIKAEERYFENPYDVNDPFFGLLEHCNKINFFECNKL